MTLARDMPARGDIVYRIDEGDELCFANNTYDEFAVANGEPELASTAVLQRPLWDFITDATTRELYRDILRRVRNGSPVHFGFRCDAPAWRRRMQMDIVPGEKRTVEFRVRTTAEEQRPFQRLLDPGAARSDELLCVCSWCKKVEVGANWMEIEDAITRLCLFESAIVPAITHGICGVCHQAMMDRLATSAKGY